MKQTENELKEMIEKRNHLELERIQLLDKVAELQIQLGMSFFNPQLDSIFHFRWFAIEIEISRVTFSR